MTDVQPSLFDRAVARRDDGMARAERHAGRPWKERAIRAVRTYAERHEFFHVDEFWEWAMARGLPEGDSPRALGPVIKQAARDGYLDRTRVSAPSVRSNTTGKPVWRCPRYVGARTGLFRGGPVV